MSAIGSKLRRLEGGRIAFWCPGCNSAHQFTVDGSRGWTWNGDGNAPTISPSVLVRTGHYQPGRSDDNCWCNLEARTGIKPQFACGVCHSFVREGRIQFLNDCTHDLAGQTVDLPDWPS